ncbi:MAG: hypothetical protein ACR2H1_04205 [Limisphaerales bacterium]
MSKQFAQYTLRKVPARIDSCLRRRAREEGRSLNQIALDALRRGSGLKEEIVHHDLDDLAGTWKNDAAFDAAIRAQDKIDSKLWR